MVIRVEKDKGNWGPNQMQIQILKLTDTIYSSLVFVRLLEIMWVWQNKTSLCVIKSVLILRS